MTLVEAIQASLTQAGVENVYIIDCPEKGSAVMVTPYMATSYDDVPLSEQRFQVYCACDSFGQSEALAWRAFRALEGMSPVGCDRVVVGRIRSVQEPYFLDKDALGRYVHAFSIAVSAVWKGEV